MSSQFTRYPALDLSGKYKIPETHTFHSGAYKEWNIDGFSARQIRQMIDQIYTEYKLMCMRGKSEVESCKTLIQCFTGTLERWWEVESSPALIQKMEVEMVKNELGDVFHNEDGTPQK